MKLLLLLPFLLFSCQQIRIAKIHEMNECIIKGKDMEQPWVGMDGEGYFIGCSSRLPFDFVLQRKIYREELLDNMDDFSAQKNGFEITLCELWVHKINEKEYH